MPERKPATKIIKASEARQQFSQLLNRVFRGETRVLVEKSGIPVAAIVSTQDLEQLSRFEAEREQRFEILDEIGKVFENVPDDELDREVTKAVAEARRQLREKAKRGVTVA